VPDDLVLDIDINEVRIGLSPIQDWWLELRRAHDGPVVWTPRNGGHWVALRGAHILEVATDSERFSSRSMFIPRMDEGPSPLLPLPITLDPPEHAAYRAILNPLATPGPVREQESLIRALAGELIDGFRAQGGCDFISDFARRIPSAVVMAMAGLPTEEAIHIAALTHEVARPSSPEAAARAPENLKAYFAKLAEGRRDRSGADVITTIVNGRVNGRPLEDDEAVSMLMTFIGAGLDTTTSLLGFAMFHLARHPDQRRRLADDPSLVGPGSTELVRRFPFVTLVRVVRRDMDFHGVRLGENELIAAPTPLVNLDETLFANPLEIDFNRPLLQNSTFGAGQHRCPGAILARAEFRIALEEWLKRIPDFELAAEAVPFRNGTVARIDALPLRWPV
jgi:cytochrome P450